MSELKITEVKTIITQPEHARHVTVKVYTSGRGSGPSGG